MTPKEYTFDAAYQPQVRAKRGTREIMLDVIIALLPALVVGVWQFGAQALIAGRVHRSAPRRSSRWPCPSCRACSLSGLTASS